MKAMDRIPNWAATLAISCLILLTGAWGGRLSVNVGKNTQRIALSREESAGVDARLFAVEEQLRELKQEVRRMTISIERIHFIEESK